MPGSAIKTPNNATTAIFSTRREERTRSGKTTPGAADAIAIIPSPRSAITPLFHHPVTPSLPQNRK